MTDVRQLAPRRWQPTRLIARLLVSAGLVLLVLALLALAVLVLALLALAVLVLARPAVLVLALLALAALALVLLAALALVLLAALALVLLAALAGLVLLAHAELLLYNILTFLDLVRMLLGVLLGLVLQVVELAHCGLCSGRRLRRPSVTVPTLCRPLGALPGPEGLTPPYAGCLRPALSPPRHRPPRLRFPDTGLAACEDELSARLRELCAGFGVCLAPWEADAHADHEAAGRAARRAGLARARRC